MSASSDSRPIILEQLDVSSEQYQILFSELLDLAAEEDLGLDSDVLEKCLQHLLYVEQVNSYINLTRITDLKEALVLHIIDSLKLLQYLPSQEGKLLDMGTGAGFPGVPLAASTSFDVTMLDSVGKKIKAVNAFVKQLGLVNAIGVHDRLESFATDNHCAFDIVVARALAPLPVLIEYATPLLSDGGFLVVTKGVPGAEELASGTSAAELCGLELVGSDEFELPAELGHRSVFVYEKVREARVKLPRNPGVAKRTPLA